MNLALGTNLAIALRALRVNKLRSALTMLGIIIGVAAVIAMIAVGSGAQTRVKEQISSLGSNLMIILPGSLLQSGVRLGSGNAQTLTEEDANAIAREMCRARAAREARANELSPSPTSLPSCERVCLAA